MSRRKKGGGRGKPERRNVGAGDWRKNLLPVLLVGILTFLVYVPTLGSGFVYDARAQIVMDDYIHDPANLSEVVTFRVLSRDVLDFNRPVQLGSLMLDSLLWGRHPAGYHFTSNLLHALTAGLVCLLLIRLWPVADSQGRAAVAGVAALVFALHPVQVEAVAEVSCREDLLATFFLLMGLLAATGFAVHQGKAALGWAIGCVVAFLLAAASKETGVVGPFVLAAYWVIFQRTRPWKRWAALLAGVVLVVGGFFLARFTLEPAESRIFVHQPSYIGGSLSGVLGIQPRLWVFMLKILVWPVGLSADYVPQNVAWISLPVALIVLTVVVGVQIVLAWQNRTAALGGLIFWLGIAPVSNFVPMFRPLADRFLYLPLTGVALMVGGALFLATRRREWTVPVLAAAVLSLIPLTVLTVQRQAVFADSLALWEDTVKKSPFSDTAANNLGYALLEAGEYEAALPPLQKAWEMTRGKKADAMAGAAIALEKLGRPVQAELALREAIKLDPRYAEPRLLVEALTATEEDAAVMREIGRRLPP